MPFRLSIVSIATIALCALACCPGAYATESKQVPVLHSSELAPRGATEMNPPAIDVSTPKFDGPELQRGKMSENRLPVRSDVQLHEPTMWERYRLQVLVVCAALLLQAGLISLLIHEHRSRNRAEMVSRKSTAELARMNRLAAAGELSASIAHEVSQPLTGISAKASASLHWLAAEKPDIEKVRAALNDIVDAAHRAKDVISGIRSTLKKGDKEKRPVHINRLIQGVLPIVQADLNKEGVELRLDLDSNIEMLEGDPTQLQQVILNQITNAIEAMHSVQPRVLAVSTHQTMPGIVSMLVADTGPGVDRENADRIFDPLFTTKSTGMGMGLSICRSIVERHRGHISVSKGVNGGAIFQIELPSIHSTEASTSILAHSLARSN